MTTVRTLPSPEEFSKASRRWAAEQLFFVVGSRIDGREEITKKITEYGCEIGNHTYGHVVLTKTDNENALRELAKNDEVIF